MKALVFLLFSLLTSESFSQNQSRQIFVQNTLFNGVSAGIGASFNHRKNEKWHKAFVRGFVQGTVGGALIYYGKHLNYSITKEHYFGYAWLGKIVHAAGTSIVLNGAYNQNFGQYWSIDIGPLKTEYFADKRKFKFRALPFSIVSYLSAAQYGKFDLYATLSSGTVVFSSLDSNLNGTGRQGVAFGRALVYARDYSLRHQVFAHENIHIFQFQEYQVFNSWFKPFAEKFVKGKVKKAFANYIFPDIPYLSLAYELAGNYENPCYYNNWFEFEAERLSSNKFVQRCR